MYRNQGRSTESLGAFPRALAEFFNQSNVFILSYLVDGGAFFSFSVSTLNSASDGVAMSDRFVLLLAAAGLFPIALSYGVVPSATIPFLLGFPVESIELTHVFRAVMGLYFAALAFWVCGAFNPSLSRSALWSLFIFMAGLATGRLLSIIVDGVPTFALVFSFLAEILFAALALIQIRKHL